LKIKVLAAPDSLTGSAGGPLVRLRRKYRSPMSSQKSGKLAIKTGS
jgi:hypothetical protein